MRRISSLILLLALLCPACMLLSSCDFIKKNFASSERNNRDRGSDSEEDADKPSDSPEDDAELAFHDLPGSLEKPVRNNPPEASDQLEGAYYLTGQLGPLPCTLDIRVTDGQITGTFWNMLYNIKLEVNGQATSSGMEIKLGKGSTLSEMSLTTSDRRNYTGTWGTKRRPVALTLHSGSRNTSPARRRGEPVTITGGGMTTHGLIIESPRMALYFPGQPADNILPMRSTDYGYEIFDPFSGASLAQISITSAGTGRLKGADREFDVTFDNRPKK